MGIKKCLAHTVPHDELLILANGWAEVKLKVLLPPLGGGGVSGVPGVLNSSSSSSAVVDHKRTPEKVAAKKARRWGFTKMEMQQGQCTIKSQRMIATMAQIRQCKDQQAAP